MERRVTLRLVDRELVLLAVERVPARGDSVRPRDEHRAVVGGRDLVFVPYFTVGTESYNTYFKVA